MPSVPVLIVGHSCQHVRGLTTVPWRSSGPTNCGWLRRTRARQFPKASMPGNMLPLMMAVNGFTLYASVHVLAINLRPVVCGVVCVHACGSSTSTLQSSQPHSPLAAWFVSSHHILDRA